jgi:polyphosphate kinase
VVVELRARFDEEYNIAWARALADAGAHVSYGMPGLKVHAKVTLVVRREGQRIRRYVHVASGNYNTATATVYTDLGLMTCDPEIAADATDLFNFLSGFTAPAGFRRILVAPLTLRARFRQLVEDEISWQRRGGAGRIILKMNALTDPGAIEALYQASQAGVDIDLIVRGMCCLRPGVPGLSENIRVRSIVGRFLEHGRVWYFGNASGVERIYLGSADLMPRNLDRRVEVMVPIEDERLKRRVRDNILATYLRDNVKARVLAADGSYARETPVGGLPVSSQEHLLIEP